MTSPTSPRRQLVDAAVLVLSNPPGETDDRSSEDIAVEALAKLGYRHAAAEKAVALVPLAFGRLLLAHAEHIDVTVQPHVSLMTGNGKWTLRYLTDDELFSLATQVALAMIHNENHSHAFERIARWSPEVQAVLSHLDSGSRFEGTSETALVRLKDEDWYADYRWPFLKRWEFPIILASVVAVWMIVRWLNT